MPIYKRIKIHITFGTGKSGIIGSQSGLVGEEVLKVRLNAPPEEGKANKELIRLLSKHFKVPKNNIQIVIGMFGREKVVQIETH
mgnify:FL=1